MASNPSPFVPGDAPGLLSDVPLRVEIRWGDWYPVVWARPDVVTESGELIANADPSHIRLSTLRPEVCDRCARWLAWVFGVPVGATAPEWLYCSDRPEGPTWILAPCEPHCEEFHAHRVPSLSSIPLDSPNRDAIALAATCRWAIEEIRAGRLEVPHA